MSRRWAQSGVSGTEFPAVASAAASGFVLLDDSDEYEMAASVLREHGWTQIALTGLAALEDNVQATSVFLRPTTVLKLKPFEMRRHPWGPRGSRGGSPGQG